MLMLSLRLVLMLSSLFLFRMNLENAINLLNHPKIRVDIPQTWGDLGCGTGLFTGALARQLAYGSKIYAVDRNIETFRPDIQEGVTLVQVKADFVLDTLPMENLDGILMANSLHFVSGKPDFIKKLGRYFRKQESYLVVEYDTNVSNTWVPYPISFISLKEFFFTAGFNFVEKIHEIQSRYRNGSIYSALIQRSPN